MIIQTSKKILLSLIFSASAFFTLIFLVSGFMAMTENAKQLYIFLCWIVAGIFLLATISSLCWITNIGKSFWLWKLPALLIFPLSIPFLILDFIESKKTEMIVETPMKYRPKIAITVSAISLLYCIPLFIFFIALKSMMNDSDIEYWIFFPLTFSFFSVIGAVFLILNTYHPNKMFKILRWFATPVIWFYLLLEVIDQKQSHYFFKHENISQGIIPENAIFQNL